MGKKCKSGKFAECAAAVASCKNLPGKTEESCKSHVGGNDAKCQVLVTGWKPFALPSTNTCAVIGVICVVASDVKAEAGDRRRAEYDIPLYGLPLPAT